MQINKVSNLAPIEYVNISMIEAWKSQKNKNGYITYAPLGKPGWYRRIQVHNDGTWTKCSEWKHDEQPDTIEKNIAEGKRQWRTPRGKKFCHTLATFQQRANRIAPEKRIAILQKAGFRYSIYGLPYIVWIWLNPVFLEAVGKKS